MRITPQALRGLSDKERAELILILQTLSTPKLARIKPTPDGEMLPPRELAEIINRGHERLNNMTPQQRAAEAAQRVLDEEELLEWRDGIGRNVELPETLGGRMVEARIRVARSNRDERLGIDRYANVLPPRVSPVAPRHVEEAQRGKEFMNQQIEERVDVAPTADRMPFRIVTGRKTPAKPEARENFPVVSDLISLFKN